MRRILGLALLLAGVLALSAGISAAGASTKFSATEVITDNGHLVLSFDEGSLKRFASVDYRLDATATVVSPTMAHNYTDLKVTVTLTPDDNGRVVGTLTLTDVSLSFPGGPCTCGPVHVAYFDMTLTNLTTGHVYRLDPIGRDFP